MEVGNILADMDHPTTPTTSDSVRRVIKLNIDLREPAQVVEEFARLPEMKAALSERVHGVALAADPDWEPMV